MSNILATIGQFIGPIYHWTLGQLITGTTVIANALGSQSERPVVLYTFVFIMAGIFIPKAVRKLKR